MVAFKLTVDKREKQHARSYQIIIDMAPIKREQEKLAWHSSYK